MEMLTKAIHNHFSCKAEIASRRQSAPQVFYPLMFLAHLFMADVIARTVSMS